jgi:hypothetical protein
MAHKPTATTPIAIDTQRELVVRPEFRFIDEHLHSFLGSIEPIVFNHKDHEGHEESIIAIGLLCFVLFVAFVVQSVTLRGDALSQRATVLAYSSAACQGVPLNCMAAADAGPISPHRPAAPPSFTLHCGNKSCKNMLEFGRGLPAVGQFDSLGRLRSDDHGISETR